MTEELMEKMEEETLRELDYAANLKTLESDAYEQVMRQVRENMAVIHNDVRINNEAAKEYDETVFQKQAKATEYIERKKDRWINVGVTAAGIVIPIVAYGVMYKMGLVFEEHGAVTSTFFRNLLNRIKPT